MMISLQRFLMLACLLSLFGLETAKAETTPNPFGTGDAPPSQDSPGLFSEEDLERDTSRGVPPPSKKEPIRNAPRLNPPTRAVAPRPARSKPSQPIPAIPPIPETKAAATPNTMKLADYLQLDSSVKGLEVKNFDLPDKEIRDVVTLISKWTGKNFILDSKVRGKITILGPSQVTLEEAYQAFLSALDANNLTTVKSGKFIRIIESAEARRSPVEIYSGDYTPDTDQFITRIFQLKYINADEVQREFRDLTSRQGKLFAYEPTNSIIITDSGSNIKRIQGILETLDIKGFETSLHVLRIKHTSSKNVAEMLDEIYGDDRSAAGGGAGRARTRTFRRSALERTRGGGIISKIIPDEQTNSLLVLANRAGFQQLSQLVKKLDVKVTDTGRIHVYYCEYAKAEDLAATLASLSGNSSAKGMGKPTTRKATVTGANSSSGSSGASSSARSGPVSAELEGGVKVTSDSATNSLVITANSGDYQTLKRVIKKLDIPRLQVFVEGAVMEISMEKDTQYGSNIGTSAPGRLFAGGFIGDSESLTSILMNSQPPTGLTIPLVSPPTYSVPLNSGGSTGNYNVTTYSFMGLLRLLTSNSNSSVLSTPQIIAMDNEKAEFKVLDKTPVQTSFVTAVGQGGAGAIGMAGQGSINNVSTGIDITLTPHINASSKSIRLEIEQKVDSIRNSGVPSALQKVQIATTSRVTNTTVTVKDQDFIMLGGLMSDKVDESVQKVPLLGDIPIVGWLFKSKTIKNIKSNLVFLMRPRIIANSTVAAETVDRTLKKRDSFIENHGGAIESQEKELDEIRSDVKRQKEAPITEDPFSKYRNNAKDDDDEEPEEPSEKIMSDPNKSAGSNTKTAAPLPDLSPPGQAENNAASIPPPPEPVTPEPVGD